MCYWLCKTKYAICQSDFPTRKSTLVCPCLLCLMWLCSSFWMSHVTLYNYYTRQACSSLCIFLFLSVLDYNILVVFWTYPMNYHFPWNGIRTQQKFQIEPFTVILKHYYSRTSLIQHLCNPESSPIQPNVIYQTTSLIWYFCSLYSDTKFNSQDLEIHCFCCNPTENNSSIKNNHRI